MYPSLRVILSPILYTGHLPEMWTALMTSFITTPGLGVSLSARRDTA
jgi:hypothetical protein